MALRRKLTVLNTLPSVSKTIPSVFKTLADATSVSKTHLRTCRAPCGGGRSGPLAGGTLLEYATKCFQYDTECVQDASSVSKTLPEDMQSSMR